MRIGSRAAARWRWGRNGLWRRCRDLVHDDSFALYRLKVIVE